MDKYYAYATGRLNFHLHMHIPTAVCDHIVDFSKLYVCFCLTEYKIYIYKCETFQFNCKQTYKARGQWNLVKRLRNHDIAYPSHMNIPRI